MNKATEKAFEIVLKIEGLSEKQVNAIEPAIDIAIRETKKEIIEKIDKLNIWIKNSPYICVKREDLEKQLKEEKDDNKTRIKVCKQGW